MQWGNVLSQQSSRSNMKTSLSLGGSQDPFERVSEHQTERRQLATRKEVSGTEKMDSTSENHGSKSENPSALESQVVLESHGETEHPELSESMNLYHSGRFLLVHLAPLGALWSGVRLFDILLCIGLYFGRMFFITAVYHRYFAHRSYKMGRVMQFLMAWGGASAMQKGPLWWAAHHRMHHKYSDTDRDVHSPLRGMWWSHVGWILCKRYMHTEWDQIRDFAKYPELRWLNKYHLVPPFVLAAICFLVGGWSALFVGFFLSTVLLYHGTFTVNSLAHIFGRRRFVTDDTSRNSLLIALITNGEGWHNNHHYYQSAARQGFFWWEIDISYYGLKALSWLRLVTDLRQVPPRLLATNRVKDGCADIGMFKAYWTKASASLANVRFRRSEGWDSRSKALEEFVVSTRKTAEHLAELSSVRPSSVKNSAP